MPRHRTPPAPLSPPRPAVALLRRYCPARWIETVEGDLEEVFRRRHQTHGRLWAQTTYWKEVLLFCLWHAQRSEVEPSNRFDPAMLNNYFKVALRHLRRHPSYSFLNVAGLATGLACCLLILLYARDELRYDRYHTNADRIYRVALALHAADEPVKRFAVTSATLAPVLLQEFPDVEAVVRFQQQAQLVRHDMQRHYEDRFFFTDARVFDVFSFGLLRGDPATALAEPRSLVLSERTARKYFGTADPVGKTLVVGDTTTMTVTGVMADVPSHSHFVPDLLASFSTVEAGLKLTTNPWAWWRHSFYTYLLLDASADAVRFEQQIARIAERYTGEQEHLMGMQQHLFLQPLTAIHLHSDLRAEIAPTGNASTVYLLVVIAGFILLLACVNFTNLSTARAASRAREVGMRKVLGAQRTRLAGQFLVESTLTAGFSLLVALGLLHLALPFFNAFTGKTLTVPYLSAWWVLPGLAATAGSVGLAAGSFPAFVLSSFRPIAVLKGTFRGRQGERFRQSLVVFQFAISILLVIGTLAINRQLDYMRSRELGFDREQIVVLPTRNDPVWTERIETLRQTWLQQPGIRHVATSSSVPGRGLSNTMILPEGFSDGETRTMQTLAVDADFVETYGLEIVAGRNLSDERPTDAGAGFLLNEAAVRDLGWGAPEDAVGKQFNWGLGKEGHVVGVVKDFHVNSLHQAVPPVVLHMLPEWTRYISVKVEASRVPEMLAYLGRQWQAVDPVRPFEYFFLDEDFDRQYRADEQLNRLFAAFSGLAILIACLGLFGLASYTAQQRTREIGVRKVLGATVTSIVLLLSRRFIVPVAIGFGVAAPVAYVALEHWLQRYAYHAALSWQLFALAGLAALLIALLTVSHQSLRAALANPAKSLRYE